MLSPRPLRKRLFLLLCEDLAQDPLLVVGLWRAHDNVRDPLEFRWAESLQVVLARSRHKVLLNFHDDVVAGHRRRDCGKSFDHTAVVKTLEAEVIVRLVIGALRIPPEAALRRPLLDFPVAEFYVLRIVLQEGIQPIKSALIREPHGKQDVILPTLGGRGCGNLDVGLGGVLHTSASEWQGLQRLRPEVHLHRKVAEGDVRKQRLSLERLWQGLGFGHSRSVHEQTHRVCIGAHGVQVEENADNLVFEELLRDFSPLLVSEKVPPVVEGDTSVTIAEDERGAGGGETHSDQLPRHRRLAR
mmetsp:Transcript_44860/g.95597  ORF Transcript_44860/g.95597 Transcript_44860/m.95597 type:complete len:300 (-) Transcript_44860:252-1151(-)